MKKTLAALAVIVAVLTVTYFVGPKPDAPLLAVLTFNIPSDPSSLEQYVNDKEALEKGVKPKNEARIIWADSLHQKTPVAFVYIHGFSASQEEGAPVHTNLAKHFGANLYLARLPAHGVDVGDETMGTLTADELVASAEEALEIAHKLGDEVVIIGTSMGGALATYLASQHNDIKAMVLYSPCIKIYDDNAEMLDNPWGLEIARQISGGNFRDVDPKNVDYPKYWTTHYRLEGVVALQNLLTHTMNDANFKKITCPTFMGYYYKDEANQDMVVSVPAMLHMFDEIKTPKDMKEKMAFPETGNHVIASYVLSKDWQSVERETVAFLEDFL